MSIGDLFWLFFMFSAIQPMLRQRMLEAMRVRKISQLERERKSRVILLVHRQETMRLLGFPIARYIDINDSEDVLRAIQMTDADVPVDLVLHTPGGLVLAALQIAKAVREHKAKVTVFVPHYAMSGGTLIALAADEIVMCEHSVLGPIDPQLGDSPAASLIKVTAEKPMAKIDDRTLVLADVGRKAIAQVKEAATELLTRPPAREKGWRPRGQAHVGYMDARPSDLGLGRKIARPADQHRHAGRRFSIAEAISATGSHAGQRRRGISARGAAIAGRIQGGFFGMEFGSMTQQHRRPSLTSACSRPADLNLRHLDGDQRRRGPQPLSSPDSRAVDATYCTDSAIAPQSLNASGGNHVSTHSRRRHRHCDSWHNRLRRRPADRLRATRVNGRSATDRQPGARNIAFTTDTVRRASTGRQACSGFHVAAGNAKQRHRSGSGDEESPLRQAAGPDPVDRPRQQAGGPDRHGRQFEHHRLEYRRIEDHYFRPALAVEKPIWQGNIR